MMEGVGTKTGLLSWLKISPVDVDVVAEAVVGPLTDQCLSSRGASLIRKCLLVRRSHLKSNLTVV